MPELNYENIASFAMSAIFISIVCHIAIWSIYHKKMLRTLAQEIGGRLTEDGTQISVHHNGRQYTIEYFTTGTDDGYKRWHTIHVPLTREFMEHKVTIYKETIRTNIFKASHKQDVLVGYYKFDQTFIIHANNPAWLKAVLNTQVMNKHMQYSKMEMKLNAGILTITKKAKLSKISIKAMLELSKLYVDALTTEKIENQPAR